MIRYRLDDLGWFQFEWLVQSLLKAELGMGIESWGGRADYGRDAYFLGRLNFPAKHLVTEGPFLFQVKFVENANAAGAKPNVVLLDAVRKEAAQINSPSRQVTWQGLRHYTLLTNAPFSARFRLQVRGIINKVIPDCQVHCLGGKDISDLLDRHATLRRSFPQLLSLRDLDELLQQALNKEVLERSTSAIECARDVVGVFVPTSSYDRAWNVLHKHHFAVLEGPPEMGKTAIAWMIALAQLSQGWEAIVCDSHEDFFLSYKPGVNQVFVADDAFGRTEYDPSRRRKWERQLDRVLRKVDAKHWLLLTSRKHILERARREMDLQGKAVGFPNPAAVLVDASKLSIQEKALILYRHARAGCREKETRELVRDHSRSIVSNPNFTPERIRRFVIERVPVLLHEKHKGQLDRDKVSTEIHQEIRKPTDRMRISFRTLPASHKWVLISLLEAGDRASSEAVRQLYEAHCPADDQKPFGEVFEELTESFAKTVRLLWNWEVVDWTHPSYRDLVIEELATDPVLNLGFLKAMSLQGIKLAISDSGGAGGERRLPLMTSVRSWDLVRERSLFLVAEGTAAEIADLLNVLCSAATEADEADNRYGFIQIVSSVCEVARAKWDKLGTQLTTHEISAYCEASLLVSPLPMLPRLESTWQAVDGALRKAMEECEDGRALEPESLNSWVETLKTIRDNEPRFLRQIRFPDKFQPIVARVVAIIENELEEEAILDSADEMHAEAERFSSIAEILVALSSLTPDFHASLTELARGLRARSSSLSDEAFELDPPSPDDLYESGRGSDDTFDIEGLFSDL